jgi:hypothetical protein
LQGFDAFEGLPEAWGAHAKGNFSVSGKLPGTFLFFDEMNHGEDERN